MAKSMISRKKINIHITVPSLLIVILIFFNLMLQEDAFSLKMRGMWIYITDICILCVGCLTYVSKKKSIGSRELKEWGKILFPFVVLTIYAIVLNSFINRMPYDEILTAGFYWIIPIVVASVLYFSMKASVINIIYNTILVNYLMVIAKCVSINGLVYLFKISTYTNNFGSLLEVHTIGLTLPLFLIYFLFEHFQNKKRLNWTFWIGALFTFMCGKRIVLIGILVVLVCYFILRKKPNKLRKKELYLFMTIVFAMTFVYLLFVKYDGFLYVARVLNINTMSRIETWGALKDLYSISPFFMGNGVGFSMYYLKNLNGIYINDFLNKVGDVHNDILKTYIDVGFWGFIFYMWYLFVKNLKFFLRKNCVETASLYFLLMIYTVFLMFVDNIMRYDLYLISLFLIPMVYKRCEEEKDEKLKNTKHYHTGI